MSQELRRVGDCLICGLPLMSAVGQVIRFHKQCRKKGRERYGKSPGIQPVEFKGGIFGS